MPLKNEFLTENPVTVKITGRLEFRKHLIMRFVIADRMNRPFIFANDGKITDPRCGMSRELILSESSPEINGRADRFFHSVVKIVTVGSDL